MNITSLEIAPGTTRYRVVDGSGKPVTRAAGIAALRRAPTFRADFVRALARSPYEAFFWEMPATSRAHQDRELEWVLVDAPDLRAIQPDGRAFAEHFGAAKRAPVVTFPNLGGDAFLVVPTPRAELDAYAHLARFVRTAPPDQVDALVETLARAIETRLAMAPTWVSTAGLGVSWLHLRLDTRPKYYRHQPYKRVP